MRDPTATLRLATVPPPVDVGATLGSYELVALLGAGAMGRVYRARHVLLGREVAIKVLNPEYVARPDIVERFFREARVVNDIDHDHIVEVTDFVEAPGLAYLVMELLDGTSLRALMEGRGRRYPSVRRITAIVEQICEALEAAHQKGVVHRDLKPDNVFVTSRDGGDFVKVLDFGIAKLQDSLDRHETSAGVILGTPHYMSPEQALGRDVDRHADVWAAGVVLYELLAGAVPFTAQSFVELATKIREEEPKPLPKKTPRGERLPASLAAVVARCLEKRPADRFRSMAAVAEALRAVRTPRRPSRSFRPFVAAVVIVATAAAGIAAWRLGASGRGRTALVEAERAARTLADSQRAALADAEAAARALAAAPQPAPATTPDVPEEPDEPEARLAPTRPAPDAERRPAAPPYHAPAPPPPRRAAAGPARPALVELHVRSTPSGATVVRLDTGERLGKTPLRVNVPRRSASTWLQVRRDGYTPIRFEVDLRKDNAANVTLRHAARKGAHRR